MDTILLESNESKNRKKKIPTLINWGKMKSGKPAVMIRNHSIRSTVHEILQFSSRLGMVRVNIVGASGTGKSSLAEVICHLVHSMSDIPYEVKFLKKEDLLDFTKTIESLSSKNYCLVFDDLSYLESEYGKKAIDKVQAALTTIRHIGETNSDRKMIVITNFHAMRALSKFLRIANFTYYSSCSSEEVEYLEKDLGKKYHQKIELFRRLRIQAMGQGRFSFALGKKGSHTYTAFDPWLPYLFSNGDNARFVCSPLRSWIQAECQTCEKVVESTKVNIEEFANDYKKKFGVNNAKRAVELKLISQGIITMPKRVQQAQKFIEQFLSVKKINLEELAEKFGLEERTTKLFPDKQPEVTK